MEATFKGLTTLRIFDSETQFKDIELDVTASKDHTASSQITDHPVEAGYKVSDHVIKHAIEFSLEGVIPTSINENKANEYFDIFTSAWSNSKLITVVTSRHIYENMVIQSFGESTRGGEGKSLRFKLSFKQIVVVKTMFS